MHKHASGESVATPRPFGPRRNIPSRFDILYLLMKLQRQVVLSGILPILLLPALSAISGCSSNATIKEDPASVQTRVDAAGKMRSYFDKANGNYDSLSAEDKAALNKLTGSEAHSREAFGHMVPTGGGLPPSGQGR